LHKCRNLEGTNFTIEREIHNLASASPISRWAHTGLAHGSYNMNKAQPSTATFAQSMRPYKLFRNVNVFGDNGAVLYNSLQAEGQKRMGLFMFNSNFTWPTNMSNWATTDNPYNITDQWPRDAANRDRYWVSFTWQQAELRAGKAEVPADRRDVADSVLRFLAGDYQGRRRPPPIFSIGW
jgi:hypothetical protein